MLDIKNINRNCLVENITEKACIMGVACTTEDNYLTIESDISPGLNEARVVRALDFNIFYFCNGFFQVSLSSIISAEINKINTI